MKYCNFLNYNILIIIGLLLVVICIPDSQAGHENIKKKKVVIHVPIHKQIEKHVHTIIKHVHHHHKPIVYKEEKVIHEEHHPVIKNEHISHEHLHHHHEKHHYPEPKIDLEEEHIHHHHNYDHYHSADEHDEP